MSPHSALAYEDAQDIFYGQIALVWARWFLIAAGAVLALWSARSVAEVTSTVLVVIGLMAVNFFVHGRYLLKQPANRFLLMALSLLDLTLTTLFVWSWQGRGGLQSPFFILYYPLLFAFALVFTPSITIAYIGLTLAAYLAVCWLADPTFIVSSTMGDWVTLLNRLITLAAMGGLGTFYWRIQRRGRSASQ
jgi:hypothetical protein